MGLTVTNINTLQLLGILGNTQQRQTDTITQLSTGLRVNKGADDPAGLIALKQLEGELTAIDAGIANNQRTDAVLGVADTSLSEIHGLLQEVESLVVASSSDANLSSAELAANQSQIDLAIQSIDRIVRTTNFNGKKLIDGSGAIETTVNSATAVSDLRVFNRGNLSSDLTMTVTVTGVASAAGFSIGTFSTGTTGGANAGTAEIAVTGKLGTATIELASGLSAAQTVTAINASKDSTGVSATVSGSGASTAVALTSTTKGAEAFITVDVLNGVTDLQKSGQDLTATSAKVSGTDATGTINGQSFKADGSQVSFNAGGVSGQFELGTALGVGASSAFTVKTSGGFTFQLGSTSDTRVTIGIDGLFSYKLGSTSSGGFLNSLASGQSADLSSASNRATALDIVKSAINQTAVANGRIGGFQKFQVKTAINSLQSRRTGLSQAKSIIADTDYAKATASLNKESVLLNSGISLLGLANQQAGQILSLLG